MVDLQPNIIYQQGGAPPHCSLHVRETPTRTFPDRWIGRDRPISWPPRSPDIIPLDFFFWWYVKDRVYAPRVPDLPTLRDRIRDVIASVTPDMLDKTSQELSSDLALFVLPVGHMLKCTKPTSVIHILLIPLSYTTNCINLAFKVVSQ
jgi:hypothetical protein